MPSRTPTSRIARARSRDSAFRDITHDWMARDRVTFGRHFDETTSWLLNALVEGIVLHRALDTEPHDATLAVAGVDRTLAARRRAFRWQTDAGVSDARSGGVSYEAGRAPALRARRSAYLCPVTWSDLDPIDQAETRQHGIVTMLRDHRQ